MALRPSTVGAALICISAALWGLDGVVLTPRLSNLPVPFVVFLLHAVPFVLMQPFLYGSYSRLRRMPARGWLALALVALTVIVWGVLVAPFAWNVAGLPRDPVPVDAIPDLSDVQVIVRTPFAGQAPQVVEDQVTYPIATAMLAVPGASDVRGFSFFGDSYVYVVFEDGTDLYWARTRVL